MNSQPLNEVKKKEMTPRDWITWGHLFWKNFKKNAHRRFRHGSSTWKLLAMNRPERYNVQNRGGDVLLQTRLFCLNNKLSVVPYGASSECAGKYWSWRIEWWVKRQNPTTWSRPHYIWNVAPGSLLSSAFWISAARHVGELVRSPSPTSSHLTSAFTNK